MTFQNPQWHEVLGNNISAADVLAMYRAENSGETLADWIERTSRETFDDWDQDDERNQIDWNRIARELERDAN